MLGEVGFRLDQRSCSKIMFTTQECNVSVAFEQWEEYDDILDNTQCNVNS